MEEDKYIFEKLKLNLERNFPLEKDNKEYSNNSSDDNSNDNPNNESLTILETKRNISKIKEYSKDNADKEKELFEMYLKLKDKFEGN